MMSSAGSQRSLADLIGVSHQIVGRILRAGDEGGYKLTGYAMTDPGLIAAVNLAFEIHRDMVKGQCRAHGLPYDPEIPIFIQRMPHADGKLGDRILVDHTHWISDKILQRWLSRAQKTGKYYAASVGSVVDLVVYSKRADTEHRGRQRNESQRAGRASIKYTLSRGIVRGTIQTQYTTMDARFDSRDVIADIWAKLNRKHSPATGAPGTHLKSRVLLQLDTRQNGRQTNKRKARGNKRRR